MDAETPRKPNRKRVLVERVGGTHTYVLRNPYSGDHKIVFGKLSRYFPDLLTQRYGDLIREDRERENYELRFPSQGLLDHSLDDARNMFEHDFAVPGYGAGWSPEAAEYFDNLYAGNGYREDYSAEWIKTCTEAMAAIGCQSEYGREYKSYFSFLLERVDKLGSKPSLLQLVKSWLRDGLDLLNRPAETQ